MAQQFVTDSGVLTIPGAYTKTVVQNNPGGLATTGVLMVIGESTGGPRFSEEASLGLNVFGPDQVGEVTAKYGSGPLVDAFRMAVSASNDAGIPGSFSGFIPVKTNSSVKGSGTIPKIGSGVYANLEAKLAGSNGNLINRTITVNTAEVVPSTGASIIAVPQVSTSVECRVNGGSAVTAALSAGDLPNTIATAINALTGVLATGGVNRNVVTLPASLTVAIVSGFNVTFTISTAFTNVPVVGDILVVPSGSALATANEGTYVVTAATSTVITARKLLDFSGAGNALTAPSAEGPIVLGDDTDLECYSPIVISSEAAPVSDGLGKSLEIANTATGVFGNIAFTTSGVAASWVSSSSAPYTIVSSAEYAVNINIARQFDAVSDNVVSGGPVYLAIGYAGTTASAVITATTLTTTVTGGSGASQVISLAGFPTISDLVTYINTLTGYSAAAGNATLGQKSPTSLDAGTYTFASRHGARNGRIKADGANFLTDVNNGNILADVSPVSPATALVGLPDVASIGFLSGGSKGGTSDADILAALDAIANVRGNFVVTLFSDDSANDIARGLTDASSNYNIASINANLRSHVLSMSTFKRRRARQGFPSLRGGFNAQCEAAANTASGRMYFGFQDIRDTNSLGVITQFSPWAECIKAAAMQAAGFYRPIVNKFVGVSGIVHAAGDFNDQNDSHIEKALKSGLNPIVRDEAGGFRWVSDQTTYTVDDNFVYNSLQAVYVADIIAATTAKRMERAFVGQSVADISAGIALTTLGNIMADLFSLKLIAASNDALAGFKNAKIKISGPAMIVSLEIKLAGAIYFVPITFLVTPVQQSAG